MQNEHFHIHAPCAIPLRLLAWVGALVVILLALGASATPAQASSGGPDSHGYTFQDSEEPFGPTFYFEDISTSGTPISLGEDEITGTIPLGFAFQFYDVEYTSIYVCANGFISFANTSCPPIPTSIPSTDAPNGGVIVAWWNDLSPQDGSVHYQTIGTAPNRRFIIQFTDVPHFFNGPRVTFQIKLFETTNIIEVHYQAAPLDEGQVHSAGIENADGSTGLQYYYGYGALNTPLAVRYWIPRFEFTKTASDTTPVPGQRITFTLGIDNFQFSPFAGGIISDTLPPGLTFIGPVTIEPPDSGIPGTDSFPLASGLTVSFNERISVTFPVTVEFGTEGPIINSAVLTGTNLSNPVSATLGLRVTTCKARTGSEGFNSVQEAIDTAEEHDLIQVSGYCAGINERDGLAQHVYLSKTVTIRGGYSPDFSQWNPEQFPTTLDAFNQGRVLYITEALPNLNDPSHPETGRTSQVAFPTIETLHLTGGNASMLGGGAGGRDVGGGIYVGHASPVVSHCQIFSNTAEYGGGVYLTASSAVLTANIFFSNTAHLRGGGLYVYGSQEALVVSNTLHSNISNGNDPDHGGGGAFLDNSHATLRNNLFWANTALRGGGLYLMEGNPTLEANIVFSNTATDGGGFYLHNSDAVIVASTAYSNTAAQGGGFYIITGTATVSSCQIFSNTANNGGGLYLHASVSELVRNSVHNNAAKDGGGLYLDQSSDTINGNTISTNNSVESGGGLYFDDGNAELIANSIVSNTATLRGGGLYVFESDAALFHENDISYNNGPDGGGGLYLSRCAATFTNNTIFHNIANKSGAGIRLIDSPATLLTNTIAFNASDTHGGGLYLTNSGATLNGNTFHDNSADYDGGGVYLDNSDAILGNNTLRGNTASRNGGGTFLTNSAATLTQNLFDGNLAWYGGGVFVQNDSPLLQANTFLSNTAMTSGGGARLSGGLTDLANNVFAYNQSPQGSGLAITAGVHRLPHNTFAQHYQGDGIGIYASSTAALTNTILVSHTLGIYVEAGAHVTTTATLWGNDTDWSGAGTLVTGTLNYWGNPHFLQPKVGNFHILSDSDALDKGIETSIHTDLDNETRPFGSNADLGADEFIPRGDVALSKRVSPNPAIAGTSVTFTLYVTNTGNIPLHATITDYMPDYLTPGHNRTWTTFLPLPAGTWTEQFSVTVDPGFLGSLTNHLELTTTEDTTATVNATVNVNAQADLALSKTVNDPTPTANSPFFYTLRVTNGGPSDATGVAVQDNLPTGVRFIADDGGGSYDPISGFWTVGSLTAGGSTELSITVRAESPASTMITNNAAIVGSYTPDPSTANNTAVVAIVVAETEQVWVYLPVIIKID